ncbi:MAG: hypothetical protein JSW27_20340 [Phycisphaerales bacterium]|nr:MAG: hypothetical protein JSW27_20340 [Phycisphaerales bacterium]
MNATIRKPLVLASLLVVSLGSVAVADSAAVQEKLKRQVEVTLVDVTIVEALEEIGKKAGVVIELSEEAIWELPEGAQTRLSVTLEGQLGQSLEEMLNAFFMRYAVGADAVAIYPRPELKHIMGRPTAQTLELLRNVYTNATYLTGEVKAVERMAQSVVSQMAGQDVSVFPLEMSRVVARVMGQMVGASQDGITVCLAPILDEVVDSVSNGSDRWVVCAPEWPSQVAQIRIIPRHEYDEIMRARIIDISFQEETGLTILRHLKGIADIKLEFAGNDQRWLERRISIEALNIKVEEALRRVTSALGGELKSVSLGAKGAKFVVQKKAPFTPRAARAVGPAPAPSASASASGDYVGKISIPMDGGKYFLEFMLRESDLTDELRQLRAERIQAILKTAPTLDAPETAPAP